VSHLPVLQKQPTAYNFVVLWAADGISIRDVVVCAGLCEAVVAQLAWIVLDMRHILSWLYNMSQHLAVRLVQCCVMVSVHGGTC
jgi:hypothetical protein